MSFFFIIGFEEDVEKGIKGNFQVRVIKRIGFVHLRKRGKSGVWDRWRTWDEDAHPRTAVHWDAGQVIFTLGVIFSKVTIVENGTKYIWGNLWSILKITC